MSAELNWLRLEHLQASLSECKRLLGRPRPRNGWLRELREAIGRTQRQQAARLGITGSAVHKAEQSEVDGTISLKQLQRMAEELECDLVYALVPRRPLSEMVEDKAKAIAREEVLGVAHTMHLENQRPSNEFLEKEIERRAAELLRGRWSNLWR